MTGNFTIMAKEVTYEEIVRNVKNKVYSPIYFLMGEEDYYIDRISDYIMDSVLTDTEKEFNQTVLYGADTDIATVINGAKRYPMMSKYQVLVVKEAQNLKNLDELVYYLQKPMPSTILVICYKHGALDRRKNLQQKSKRQAYCSNRKAERCTAPRIHLLVSETQAGRNRTESSRDDGRICRHRLEPNGGRIGKINYHLTFGTKTYHSGTDRAEHRNQ